MRNALENLPTREAMRPRVGRTLDVRRAVRDAKGGPRPGPRRQSAYVRTERTS